MLQPEAPAEAHSESEAAKRRADAAAVSRIITRTFPSLSCRDRVGPVTLPPLNSHLLLLATIDCCCHSLCFARLVLFSALLLSLQYIAMSSSIAIPTRSAYGDGGKAAASSSSSSSTYSFSPRTPQNQTTSPPTSPNTKYGHDRRPSLLSKFYLVPLAPVEKGPVKPSPTSAWAEQMTATHQP
jgi:hypothetical protein